MKSLKIILAFFLTFSLISCGGIVSEFSFSPLQEKDTSGFWVCAPKETWEKFEEAVAGNGKVQMELTRKIVDTMKKYCYGRPSPQTTGVFYVEEKTGNLCTPVLCN